MVLFFREGGAHSPAVITTTDTTRFTTHLHTVPHGPRCSKNAARFDPLLPSTPGISSLFCRATQCTTRIQETWLQIGFPCQLKLVSRQKPVPSLPRSWPKPTVPDSENFTQFVHSSKMTFFFQNSRTTHRWVWRFGRKGVFSCRHRSVSAYAQYSWETIGTIYR